MVRAPQSSSWRGLNIAFRSAWSFIKISSLLPVMCRSVRQTYGSYNFSLLGSDGYLVEWHLCENTVCLYFDDMWYVYCIVREMCFLCLLVNIPVEGIRLLDAVCLLLGKRRHARQKTPCLLQRCGLSLVSSAPKKWRLTRWPLKGNSEVHLHTPTKFGEDPSKDLGGVGEQTDRQTDKCCSIYCVMFLY